MRKLTLILLVFLTLLFNQACEEDLPIPSCEESIQGLHLNEYKILGSHNSYRLKTPEVIMELMRSQSQLLPEWFDPGAWDYSHESIRNQLENYGIRSLELDVYRDPEGGLFYNRMAYALLGMDVASYEPALKEPGLKVLHFPDLDFMTHYLTFKDALQDIKSWSLANPNHLPITILVEAKEDSPDLIVPGMGLTSTIPFRLDAVEEIEDEINEVFKGNMDHIIKPDDVRKGFPTLRVAVMTNAWPTIQESRGKIIFVLMANDVVRFHYTKEHPSLWGRSMFVFAEPWQDEAAFIKIDEPIGNFNEIREYVNQGFIVRTQADANTVEARYGNFYRLGRAMDSGAQIISTDYYLPDPRAPYNPEWSNYFVDFESGKIALVNHLIAPSIDDQCVIGE